MMMISCNEVIKITDQRPKPGYVKNNVVHGGYSSVVKGNGVQMKLSQKEPGDSIGSMILYLTQCMTQFMSTMQNMIEDQITAQILQTFLNKN